MSKLEKRILAYQMEHNVSYDEALKALQVIDYNNLVCSGISPEQAKEIVYGDNEEKQMKK